MARSIAPRGSSDLRYEVWTTASYGAGRGNWQRQRSFRFFADAHALRAEAARTYAQAVVVEREGGSDDVKVVEGPVQAFMRDMAPRGRSRARDPLSPPRGRPKGHFIFERDAGREHGSVDAAYSVFLREQGGLYLGYVSRRGGRWSAGGGGLVRNTRDEAARDLWGRYERGQSHATGHSRTRGAAKPRSRRERWAVVRAAEAAGKPMRHPRAYVYGP